MKQVFLPVFALIVLYGCKKNMPESGIAPFSNVPIYRVITPGIIDEASGIADSKANPGFLWVEQDSDNPAELFLVGQDITQIRKISIKGAENRDWEDIAVGNGPELNTDYIYLADIGDNYLTFSNYFIYRFKEPSFVTDTVYSWERVTFQYPDGSNDAEAILIDDTGDIYIITKSGPRSKIYKLRYPTQATQLPVMATLVGELPFNGVVSAALSPDLKEIVVKTYTTLSYWSRRPQETIEATLKRPSTSLVFQIEPKGEAVCFTNQNTGLYTLSERPAGVSSVTLNFYNRK